MNHKERISRLTCKMLGRDLQSLYNCFLVVVNDSTLENNELSISSTRYDITTDVVLYATFNINVVCIRSAEYNKLSAFRKRKGRKETYTDLRHDKPISTTIDFSLRCLIVISSLSVHDASSTSFSFVADDVAIEGSGRM